MLFFGEIASYDRIHNKKKKYIFKLESFLKVSIIVEKKKKERKKERIFKKKFHFISLSVLSFYKIIRHLLFRFKYLSLTAKK